VLSSFVSAASRVQIDVDEGTLRIVERRYFSNRTRRYRFTSASEPFAKKEIAKFRQRVVAWKAHEGGPSWKLDAITVDDRAVQSEPFWSGSEWETEWFGEILACLSQRELLRSAAVNDGLGGRYRDPDAEP